MVFIRYFVAYLFDEHRDDQALILYDFASSLLHASEDHCGDLGNVDNVDSDILFKNT